MNNASPILRERLGLQIKEYLRRGAVRQRELAQKLGISGSAVSQMIHGRIVPSSAQLKSLGEMLDLNRSERCELSSLLAKIRVNDDGLRSHFNEVLTELRTRRGLDRSQLAALSGVAESQLLGFENLFDACPTPDEIRQLSAALQVDSSLLTSALQTDTQVPAPYRANPTSLIAVAEPQETYRRKQNMPEILLGSIGPDFDGKDFSLYAATHSHLVVERDFPAEWKQAVLVSATGSDLSLPCNARVELVVANSRPANGGTLELCRTGKGNFFLVDGGRGREKVLRFCGTIKMSGRILWRLPVLEIVIKPIQRCKVGGPL